jgi:hypothetical protein
LAFYVGECIEADVMLQEKKRGPRDSSDIRGKEGGRRNTLRLNNLGR